MSNLPYITAPGNIGKALNEIKLAKVPELVSQDFVKTILKIPGGSGSQMTSFLKKINFADSSGAPTDLYKKYRNPSTEGLALAEAIKIGYSELFNRNEYLYKLSAQDLTDLIIEHTGLAHDSNVVKCISSCLSNLIELADFEASKDTNEPKAAEASINQVKTDTSDSSDFKFNLGYTINLNLPVSTDPAVFDAIFKSLKNNLLRQEDV